MRCRGALPTVSYHADQSCSRPFCSHPSAFALFTVHGLPAFVCVVVVDLVPACGTGAVINIAHLVAWFTVPAVFVPFGSVFFVHAVLVVNAFLILRKVFPPSDAAIERMRFVQPDGCVISHPMTPRSRDSGGALSCLSLMR